MQIIDKDTFFGLTNGFSYVPFTQSEGWWEMHSLENKNRFRFYIDSIEHPTIGCMGHVKKKFGLTMLQIEGECLVDGKNIDNRNIREFYKEISQTGFDIIEVNSSLPYHALYEIGIREAGYLRPVGLFSSALSNWIDLKQEIRYNENWKRNLKKAEKANLKLNVLDKPTDEQMTFYADFYNRFTAEKGFAHHVTSKQMKALLQSDNFRLALVTDGTGTIQAGIVFHYHKQHAGLFITARNVDSKEECGVTFFMYDQLFKYLKNANYTTFDMEKLTPSIHSKQPVFLFKNGVRGEKMLYCGEFSYYKRTVYRPLMYVVKKYLLKKIEV